MIDCQIKHVGPDRVLLVELSGQLDTVGCDHLHSTIQRELHEELDRLIIDCQGLDYISSNGLGALVQIHNTMKDRGGEARITGVQGVIAEVIHMVLLDKVLRLYPSVEAASSEEGIEH